MNLSRRSFLQGAISVTAIAAAPFPAFGLTLPVLHGNGVGDDTEALNALLNHKPALDGSTMEVISRAPDGRLFIHDGRYRVTDTLHIRGHDNCLEKGIVVCEHGGEWMVEVHLSAERNLIRNMIFKHNPALPPELHPKGGIVFHGITSTNLSFAT